MKKDIKQVLIQSGLTIPDNKESLKTACLVWNNCNKIYKPLKVAKSYDVEMLGKCIPKNAIYGRLTKDVYICVDCFSQFSAEKNYKLFQVYLGETGEKFKPVLIKKYSLIYWLVLKFIAENRLFSVKTEPVLCMKKLTRPKMREPQRDFDRPRGRVNFELTTDFNIVNQISEYRSLPDHF